MDNQKDYVHIDDVFKKLRGGEEKERSGSWLNMKELLDKELPLEAPVATRPPAFRRYLIPAAVLLLAGIGAATYLGLHNSKPEVPTSSFAEPHKDTNRPIASSTVTSQPQPKAENAPAQNMGKETPNEQGGRGNNRGNNQATASKKASVNPSAAHTVNNDIEGGPDARFKDLKTNKGPSTSFAHQKEAQPVHDQAKASQPKDGSRPAMQEKALASYQTGPSIIEEQKVIEQIHKANGGGQPLADKTLLASVDKKDIKKTTTLLNNKVIVQAEDGKFYKEERDTFSRLKVTEYYSKLPERNNLNTPKIIIDTVAYTRIEKVSYIPLTPKELGALQKANIPMAPHDIVPMSGLKSKTVSKELVSLVPLNKYKVSTKKVDPNSFNAFWHNTTNGLTGFFDGSKNFYVGLILGGNVALGSTGAFGMQAGLAGIYSLSERITLAAELKFANRYFSNYTIEDQSVSYEDVTYQALPGSQWLFSGTEMTQTSKYRLKGYRSFEIPLIVSYNFGRVSLLGGPQLSIGMPMQWSKETSYDIKTVELPGKGSNSPFINTPMALQENKDFGARTGIGYVMGINYDISRQLSFDARLTQILTDNAQGNLSPIKDLFRMPTLQFSVNYYLGRKEKVIYIMDRK